MGRREQRRRRDVERAQELAELRAGVTPLPDEMIEGARLTKSPALSWLDVQSLPANEEVVAMLARYPFRINRPGRPNSNRTCLAEMAHAERKTVDEFASAMADLEDMGLIEWDVPTGSYIMHTPEDLT